MKRPVTLTVEKTRQRAPWAPTSILRAGVALRNVVVETYNGFKADRGLDLAGSLAFATLLLAVPLLATFALLFAAFFQDNVNEIVDLANRILPFHAARLSVNLREFIQESLAISGIGLAVLIGSSIRMSAAPASARSTYERTGVRESAKAAISAPKVTCIDTATRPLRRTCPRLATPMAPAIAPIPNAARSTLYPRASR